MFLLRLSPRGRLRCFSPRVYLLCTVLVAGCPDRHTFLLTDAIVFSFSRGYGAVATCVREPACDRRNILRHLPLFF
jgi:hypothetical protein